MRVHLPKTFAFTGIGTRLKAKYEHLTQQFSLSGNLPRVGLIDRQSGLPPSDIEYATSWSAGFDLRSNENVEIPPGEWRLVDTGLALAPGHAHRQSLRICWRGIGIELVPELQIRPRSGLAAKHGITLLNTPGTVDADYQGPILCTLFNASRSTFTVAIGDRIAQGVVSIAIRPTDIAVRDAHRGAGGFGSTGR